MITSIQVQPDGLEGTGVAGDGCKNIVSMQPGKDDCIVGACDLGREQTDCLKSLASRQGRTTYGSMPNTILIVDDNASVRQMICEAFKRESDFEVCG
jgi:hypothetical protein